VAAIRVMVRRVSVVDGATDQAQLRGPSVPV